MSIPVKPKNVTWTTDQWRAIYESRRDILVAAAAGSGKTAVLVERIIQKIIDEKHPVDVDELLVATFTNASAAEMRHRIGQAIEKEIERNPNSHHLRKQLQLLNNASISTLHSFCLNVVRKYYYMIDIDPGFRIADQTEMLLVRDEVVETMLEEEYGKQNQDFFQLVDLFTNDRSDVILQDLILKLYDFSRSNPYPNEWLEKIVGMYDTSTVDQVDDLPFIEPLLIDIELNLREANRLFHEGLELTKLPGGPHPRAENFLADIELTEALISAKNESFETLFHAMQQVKFSTLKRCSGDEFDQELVTKSTNLRNKGKKIIQHLKETFFSRKPSTFLQDLQEMKQPVRTLVRLVRDFSAKFEQVKREKGIVDFSDLEHYALQILGKRKSKNTALEPTEAALHFRQRFKEVLIDEYQDTNMVQETILQLVKKPTEENGNLFMVGDVKQSIYRFRLAEPNLFLQKYLRFFSKKEGGGLRIDLAKNFRSRKEILDGTNFLFKQIMDKKIGEIDYDERAELKKGAPYPEDEPHPIELVIISKEGEEEEPATHSIEETDEFAKEELEQSEMESRFVARKIRELIDSKKQIFDPKTKTYRPIRYRDIVILFRSFVWAPQFMEELKDYGIPAYADMSTGYFEAAEVSTMLALLQIIDNPYQDIPLAAVFRSPMIGLKEEDLARIRIADRKGTFYEAAKAFVRHPVRDKRDEWIHSKLTSFFKNLSKWRSMARQGALSELIWALYRDTNFYDFVGGLPGGKQRQANLRALYDRARQYESTSFRGLFRFLRFIEKMRKRGSDLGTARALGEQEDVVRLMTIHGSKGLEFPVVFIVGLARKFNFSDLKQNYLLDKNYGFATNYMNAEKQITYPSLFHMSIARKKRLEQIAEEMRVLYVALTRAKEALYLVASVKNIDEESEKWQKHLDNPDWLLADYDRMKAEKFLDWIGPALIRHRSGHILRREDEQKEDLTNREIYNHPSEFIINVMTSEQFERSQEEEKNEDLDFLTLVKKGEPIPVQSSFRKKIEDQLNWTYPYMEATVFRSKQSVSELKRLKEIRDVESGEDLLPTWKKPITTRPKFMQEKSLSPAEKGTAMHMVMQHIDLTMKPTESSLKSLLFSMEQKELLTPEEAEAIDISAILSFFETEIGERLLRAKWVKRELPFSYTLPAREIYSTQIEDSIFIQGIIDCLFQDDQGLILLDYKTDQITRRFKNGFEGAKPILLNRYKIQMQLYKRAVEGILNKSLAETYLFFFDGAHLLQVNLEQS
ncbi:helicase-exonuclease AddAB subunit AddA [Fervidibacillus halotolerans]|uniref:ATP-dependent helicase/nuclease subunit A n=1 Tax=Fervidibacillus halotolerans TaxID=2980027 RepID=A0A9E8RXS1_9BACI|nr:helicase-exonuclease AddAB subunit AddA [Fervidibacillus halotolerans]WAA13035.1 helicase-exonuclease AddAB subunit AddA [Fervidibacillus halotolerans]